MSFFEEWAQTLLLGAAWFAGLFCLFGVLAKAAPQCAGQRLMRKGMMTDLCYWFILPLFGRFVRVFFLALAAVLIFGDRQEDIGRFILEGYGPLAQLPLIVQMVLILVVSDVLLYWLHRLFHRGGWWHFHAIHHSSEELDWLSSTRFHPVNIWLTFTLVDTLMLAAGFAPAAVVALAPLNLLYSSFVHANIRCTLGPLRYVLASPMFHRWHHVARGEGLNKNFAPTFPVLDLMFGTFYMPKDEAPEILGIGGAPVPENFIGQMVYPFRRGK